MNRDLTHGREAGRFDNVGTVLAMIINIFSERQHFLDVVGFCFSFQ